jgi:AbrB family looped-hinge helix DNA binding protein
MDHCKVTAEDMFYGTATIGERGQVVIPADARKDCDIHAGDKLLVFRHPMHPRMLILAKLGEMERFLQQMSKTLEEFDQQVRQAAETAGNEQE